MEVPAGIGGDEKLVSGGSLEDEEEDIKKTGKVSVDPKKDFTNALKVEMAFEGLLDNALFSDCTLVVRQAGGCCREIALLSTKSYNGALAMLSYIYLDNAKLSSRNVAETIELAAKYHLDYLSRDCSKFLENGITVSNACALFQQGAEKLRNPSIGLEFIKAHTDQVFKSRSFLKLSQDRLKVLLECEFLSIEEEAVFIALARWAAAEADRRGLLMTQENLRKVVDPLLHLVRFPVMSSGQIARLVAPSGLLRNSELVEIFTYVAFKEKGNHAKLPKIKYPVHPRKGTASKWDLVCNRSEVRLKGDNTIAEYSPTGPEACLLGSQDLPRTIVRHAWRITLLKIIRRPVFAAARRTRRGTTNVGIINEKARSRLSSLTSFDGQGIVWNSAGQFRVKGIVQPRRVQIKWDTGGPIDICLDYSRRTVSLYCHRCENEYTWNLEVGETYTPFFSIVPPNHIKVLPISPDLYKLPSR
ncbi:hypothetical protein AAMO2058_001086900 [Amorphochlora amoebiformis]